MRSLRKEMEAHNKGKLGGIDQRIDWSLETKGFLLFFSLIQASFLLQNRSYKKRSRKLQFSRRRRKVQTS
jgi:hypothetical protein